jgi:HTH-type transcriptional regulator/antitoxin HigA
MHRPPSQFLAQCDRLNMGKQVRDNIHRRDCRRILKEIEGLMRAKRNTPGGDRLDVLVTFGSLGAEALSA